MDIKTKLEKRIWVWTGYIWLRTTTTFDVCEHGNDIHYTWTLREPQRNSFFALSARNLNTSSENTMTRSPVRSATRSACLGLSPYFRTIARSFHEACACSKLSKWQSSSTGYCLCQALAWCQAALQRHEVTRDHVTYDSSHVPPGTHRVCLTHRTWTRENDDDKIWISKSSFAEPREVVHERYTMRQYEQEQTCHCK